MPSRLTMGSLVDAIGNEQDKEATSSSSSNPQREKTQYESASLWSKAFFLWPYPLLGLGKQRTITEDDLPDILQDETSARNLEYMEMLWKKAQDSAGQRQKQRRTRTKRKKNHQDSKEGAIPISSITPANLNLHRVLVVDFLKDLWFIQVAHAVGLVARVGQAMALGLLIEYFSESTSSTSSISPDRREGHLWAFVLVMCGVVILFEHHHVFMYTWRKGMQYKTAAVAAIYAKSLRLSSIGGIDAAPSGKIMNLASNDVERFNMACLFGSYLLWGPIYAVVVLILGLVLIGPAFAAGYAFLLLFVPLQFYLSHRFATLRSKIARITDSRVNLVSQAVAGARVMKMSGWEPQFKERIEQVRHLESNKIQQANRLRALNEGIYFCSSVVMSVVIFTVHVAIGGVLTPRNVFTTMTLINVVQFELMKHFSLAVMALSECHVSVTRLQHFLATPEPPLQKALTGASGHYASGKNGNSDQQPLFVMKNVTCYWDLSALTSSKQSEYTDAADVEAASNTSGDAPASLSSDYGHTIAVADINLKLLPGELCCVIGAVGSGKSALLEAMTGELPHASGEIIRRNNTLAYSSQEPFLMDGTIRENITFGLPFREEWYHEILQACGLHIDLQQFRNGDDTIVGDRGVQCSGGQRARIGLARTLYRNAQVILLDDPLSAVDTKVGKLIFYSAIMDLCVNRGKCVVLATHQHQFIGDARCILLKQGGRIVCDGSYEECVAASNGTITSALRQSTNASTKDLPGLAGDNGKKQEATVEKIDAQKLVQQVVDDKEDNNEDGAFEDDALAHKEQKSTGIVKLSTFMNYLNAMGGIWVGVFVLCLFAAAQVMVLVTITMQGDWAELPPEEQNTPRLLALILGLGASVVLLSLLRSIFGFYITIRASRKLHDSMMAAVLRAKIEFFDTNPLGRILNRFSADVGIVDDLLPQTIFDFVVCAFMVLGGIATTAVVLPFILVLFPPMIVYFVYVRKTFLATSRELKRIEGVARSPICAMLGESLQGVATMRANDSLAYFRLKFEKAQNDFSRAYWSFLASSRWLGFRMDFIMTLLLAVASFLAVVVNEYGWLQINSSLLGLALMLIIQLSALFQWCVRQSAEVVNYMVSVERIVDFSCLPAEADLVTAEDAKHPNWPQHGSVECQDLVVRYRAALPPSLKGASFQVQSGQRIGVVGRTGAGKSTLAQALFRLLEAESGSITIDGVDIAKLGLHKLRTQMSVIPQSPILFDGCSIRENLDPFGKYDDGEVWEALGSVQMESTIRDNLSGGLNSIVAEGGSNFSVGQRQLLCLARAILRKNQILILDEPTANVDSQTDKLLQQAIQKSFGFATILAIAHRLDTVIDYDNILVLGAGQVLEFGSPTDLLDKTDGVFASMVRDTGELMSAELKRMASEAAAVSRENNPHHHLKNE
jgi:ATP-binding cassette subfamily C (CFTR/MRP) protein 4